MLGDGGESNNSTARGSSGSNNASDNKNSDNKNNNPFVRFRHHVDANIHAGINTLTGHSRSTSNAGNDDATSPSSIPGHHPASTEMTTATISQAGETDPLALARDLGLLTPQEAHLESRLAALQARGGSNPAQAHSAWRLFLLRSAYSPLRLEYDGHPPRPQHHFLSHQHQHYPQYQYHYSSDEGHVDAAAAPWRPVPRDLPAGCAPGEVGWPEAFEDLLRVSSGLAPLDLAARVRENRARAADGSLFGFVVGALPGVPDLFAPGGGGGGWLSPFHRPHQQHYFPGGLAQAMGFGDERMKVAVWAGRMEAQGLSEVLFPVCDPGLGYQSPRTMEEWVERRRAEERREKETDRLWEELLGEFRRDGEGARRLSAEETEEARQRIKRELDAWWDAGQDTASSFFDGIGGIVRTLGKVLEDEAKTLQRFGKGDKERHERGDDAAADTNKDASTPETENDLYSLIQSAFHESERSLSNFFKTLSEGWHSPAPSDPKPASPPRTETTETVEDGITKKTTRKDFVDEHGNTHAKTETTWTDESGRVIMRQVHSSMGRAEHWGSIPGEHQTPAKQQEQEQQQQQEQQQPGDEPKPQKKESGWFWK